MAYNQHKNLHIHAPNCVLAYFGVVLQIRHGV